MDKQFFLNLIRLAEWAYKDLPESDRRAAALSLYLARSQADQMSDTDRLEVVTDQQLTKRSEREEKEPEEAK